MTTPQDLARILWLLCAGVGVLIVMTTMCIAWWDYRAAASVGRDREGLLGSIAGTLLREEVLWFIMAAGFFAIALHARLERDPGDAWMRALALALIALIPGLGALLRLRDRRIFNEKIQRKLASEAEQDEDDDAEVNGRTTGAHQ